MKNVGVQFGSLPQLHAPSGVVDELEWMRNVGVQFGSMPHLHTPSGVRDEVGWMRNVSVVVYNIVRLPINKHIAP
jgi:hypothetical protein